MFEDVPTGLASAVASGARVVGVPRDSELLPDPAWTLVPTLTCVRLDDLFALVGRAH
ncbi:hypothetical protein [Frondihabitans australicus]|uniref:HAD superfamily hydrolase (TIGR01509 family) n=1 Tax=Frondihabitans australicus TaxID=386892 RepID=A0A495IL90_9MICO|nr:hypothetical protein [Frondihabitans australicus]RKR75926.1 hypothetical protein C8E83_3090 [Frondihabitans australicus]